MICGRCHLEKDEADFSIKKKQTGKRHTICKACHVLYRRTHYLQNKAKYIEKAKVWNLNQKRILQQFLLEKLTSAQCIDCGEKDIVVLDFDHIIDKNFGIAVMFRNRHSVESIEKELSKCVVRCANCHRRRTAKEAGYWKYKVQYKTKADLGA